MQNVPQKRRVAPRATKFPNQLSNKSSLCSNAQLNNQNLPPVSNYRMSDKSALAIKKSMDIFEKSLNQSKFYLSQFGNKVQHIYEREIYRSYLKQRSYTNLIKKMQVLKKKTEDEIVRVKQQNLKEYKDILEENQKLQQLKKSYIDILSKNQSNLKKQTDQYNLMHLKNESIKQKIKQLWKKLPSQQLSNQKLSKCRQITCQKSEQNKTKNQLTQKIQTGASVTEQDQSLYITRNVIDESSRKNICNQMTKQTQFTEPIHSHSFLNEKIKNDIHQLSLMGNSSLKNHRLLKQDSLRGYQQAIQKIQKLQLSILMSKRGKNKKQNAKISAPSQQETRKQRIRQRIEQIEYKNDIIKLFIIYLKTNDSTQNKTGLQNLPKIIFYLEKVLKDKQDILKQVKEMGKNLRI